MTTDNPLEHALILAADEPAHRPHFYTILMDSQVYLLGTTEIQSTEKKVNLKAGSKVQIQHWQKPDGSPVIPFFSSLEVLQKSIATEEAYLVLPVRAFFEMTRGARLFLNPQSDYGKEFSPNEVEQLLSFDINQAPSQRVVEQETKVLLGQPSNYPTKMIASVSQLLGKHHNVKKAYLALMQDTSIDEKPHLIIGIEAEGHAEKVIREVGSVASDTLPDGESVDLYLINKEDSGLSQYFINQVQPFYQKNRAQRSNPDLV